jgi:hypothetical protein
MACQGSSPPPSSTDVSTPKVGREEVCQDLTHAAQYMQHADCGNLLIKISGTCRIAHTSPSAGADVMGAYEHLSRLHSSSSWKAPTFSARRSDRDRTGSGRNRPTDRAPGEVTPVGAIIYRAYGRVVRWTVAPTCP